MIITRKSPFTGTVNSMYLPVTEKQMEQYKAGAGLIQNIFPNLDAGEREFIKTGITPVEWDNMFGKC